MHVLVVEDDVKLARALRRGLALEGHLVDVAVTGEEGLALGSAEDYDAIVLGLVLPGLDGFDVLERLRARRRDVPVLVLTARTSVADRIGGLDGGADDYLVKPLDLGELLARLRVLVRRGTSRHGAVLTVGDLRVDVAGRVVLRGGRQIELTPREFDVLAVLARSADRLVTRQQLLDAVWQPDYGGSPNVADVYVGYLRRKLESPSGPRLLHTVRGSGWRLSSS